VIQITKDTLRHLNAAVGSLDLDTNQIFVGFIGCLEMSDGLYHGSLRYAPAGEDAPKETVSIKSILGNTGGEADGYSYD